MKIKGFDKNLRCRGFQFEIGKEYKIDSKKLELCSDKVFHYCDTLRNVHDFYPVTSNNRYCEIEVLGEEIHDNNYKKFGSNHIKIVREITGEELDYLKGLHSGNTGYFNTGYYNTGCFNTKNSKIKMFNKDSDITYMDWLNSEARSIMDRICFNTVEWIAESGMTEEEKEKYPSYETTGGYLRKRDTSECYKEWWEDLTDEEKDIIKDIPNFDVDIFKEITGIDVEQ